MLYKQLKNLIPSELCLYYDTAWIGHGTFAMWSVLNFQPKSIVELGSHGGYSYFAFCEAVKKHKLDTQLGTKCYAIDSWEGDDHASFYDNSIYEEVKKINTDKYSSFSKLVRKYFDQAVDEFPDGSIDLLHIDGRHGYEDVKYDFECYEKKLSDNAVVLFHDTNCYKPGFGVYKFFDELRQKFPHSDFEHSSGLGIIFYGKNLRDINNPSNPFSKIMQDLCNRHSALYKALYLTGLNNMHKYKLARIIKNKHSNPNSTKQNNTFRVLRHKFKIKLRDLLYNWKVRLP